MDSRAGTGRRILVAAIVGAALIGGPATAGAYARVDSFDGTCSVQGTVSFSPPATNSQQPLDVTYDGTGTCSGKLNGREIASAPVQAHNAAHDVNGSCARADTTEPGSGSLTFADGTVIRFAVEFHFLGTHGQFSLRGRRSGSARGIGSFVTSRTPPDIALQCAGAGARSAPLDISLATDGPLTSGTRA